MMPSAVLSLLIYTLLLRSSNPFKTGPYSKRMDIVSDTFAVQRDTFSYCTGTISCVVSQLCQF